MVENCMECLSEAAHVFEAGKPADASTKISTFPKMIKIVKSVGRPYLRGLSASSGGRCYCRTQGEVSPEGGSSSRHGRTVAERREATDPQRQHVRPAPSVGHVLRNSLAGDNVRVQGWVKGLRKMKKFVFFDVYDGLSGHKIPVVIPAEQKPKELNMHTSVDVCGVLLQNPNNPAVLELHPSTEPKVFGGCDQETFPFAGKGRYTPDYVRQWMHLRPKTMKFGSLLRIRNATVTAINSFFNRHEFVQIQTPILTANDCEGGGETFIVRPDSEDLLKEMTKERNPNDPKMESEEIYFDKKVHLTVSGQLHLETAVGGLGKVWTMSPVFRAENSRSTRHLSEFYMLEAEIAFAYNIEDILELMEDLVKSCIHHILYEHQNDWKIVTEDDVKLKESLEGLLKLPFTVMTFDEAKTLLKSRRHSDASDKGLSREDELFLTEKVNGGVPVFVVDWPASIKPFYMRRCVDNPSKVSAVDLLVPGVGELCGGSLREHDPELLQSTLNLHDPSGNLSKSLAWYTELRKYGGVPSGGFGLGFDRLIQLITGIKTIKDVSPFPRWAHHCTM